jgi:hypothetical protein
MKTLLKVSLVSICVIFFACGSKEKPADGSVAAATEEESESTDKPAVCIWKEVSIKETAGEKGKYKTSIFLGEKFKALPDTASEVTGSKRVFYRKVRLTDGAEGWVRADFIAVDAVPAAFIKEATLYKRPDIMTTSGKNFFLIDFVAIKSTADGGWAEVIGKRAGDTWFSSGWVKSENLSTTDVDVAFSSLYMRAKEISDPTKQAEAIETLLANSELSSSVFQSEFATDGDYEEDAPVEDFVEDETSEEGDSEGDSESDNN